MLENEISGRPMSATPSKEQVEEALKAADGICATQCERILAAAYRAKVEELEAVTKFSEEAIDERERTFKRLQAAEAALAREKEKLDRIGRCIECTEHPDPWVRESTLIAERERADRAEAEIKTLKSLEQQAWHKAQFEADRAKDFEAEAKIAWEKNGRSVSAWLTEKGRAEAAEKRVVVLEERLPHYHNEAQCGVIKSRLEAAEKAIDDLTNTGHSSYMEKLEAAEKERDEWKEKHDQLERLYKAAQELNAESDDERVAASSLASRYREALRTAFYALQPSGKDERQVAMDLIKELLGSTIDAAAPPLPPAQPKAEEKADHTDNCEVGCRNPSCPPAPEEECLGCHGPEAVPKGYFYVPCPRCRKGAA